MTRATRARWNDRARAAVRLASVSLLAWAATAAGAGNPEGFLYGKVTTGSGSVYEGRLRWDDEESFWGDFFNSSKEERPWADQAATDRRRRREPIRIFGITVGVRWNEWNEGRAFKARFGDVREIRVTGGDSAKVIMKSGVEYEVEGGSNDVGAKVRVWDEGVGEIALEWKRIDRIEFKPTPRKLKVEPFRLHGTVHADQGPFRGWIQWDQDECLSTDKLDGDSRDGELAIEMGKIRSIAKRSSSSSRVTLRDGREFVLDGSNDVDDDNRGIFVEDERFGRVLVKWDAFERIEFSEPGDSGPPYASFRAAGPIRGRVTTRDGSVHRGRLVYDLDEAETWELLDGEWRDVEYSIPFSMIASISPGGGDSSGVVLENGTALELEDAADVGDANDGVAVLDEEGRLVVYWPWDRISRIELD